MGKYKKPKQQSFKQPNIISQNEQIINHEVFVDRCRHTPLTIKKIVDETLIDYKQKISENKWINSQKQKQHLIDYYAYKGIGSGDMEVKGQTVQEERFFTKLLNRIKRTFYSTNTEN